MRMIPELCDEYAEWRREQQQQIREALVVARTMKNLRLYLARGNDNEDFGRQHPVTLMTEFLNIITDPTPIPTSSGASSCITAL